MIWNDFCITIYDEKIWNILGWTYVIINFFTKKQPHLHALPVCLVLFLAMLHGLWELSSSIRDWLCALSSGRWATREFLYLYGIISEFSQTPKKEITTTLCELYQKIEEKGIATANLFYKNFRASHENLTKIFKKQEKKYRSVSFVEI